MSRIFALIIAITILPFSIGCGGSDENKVVEYDAAAQAAIEAEEEAADRNRVEEGEVAGGEVSNDEP